MRGLRVRLNALRKQMELCFDLRMQAVNEGLFELAESLRREEDFLEKEMDTLAEVLSNDAGDVEGGEEAD